MNRPLAVGIDSRSRGFKPALLVKRIKELRAARGREIETLFLDCAGAELERPFTETRRRHPLADDRPAAARIARTREMRESPRPWARHVVAQTQSIRHNQ